jgi:hypothetical protein
MVEEVFHLLNCYAIKTHSSKNYSNLSTRWWYIITLMSLGRDSCIPCLESRVDPRPNLKMVMMKNIFHTGNSTLVIHPLPLTIIMAILAYNYVLRWLTMCILQNYPQSKLPIEVCLKFKFV